MNCRSEFLFVGGRDQAGHLDKEECKKGARLLPRNLGRRRSRAGGKETGVEKGTRGGEYRRR